MRPKRFSAKISLLAITALTPGCDVTARGRSWPVRPCAITKIPQSAGPTQKSLRTLLAPTSWRPEKPKPFPPSAKSCTSSEKANASNSCPRLRISFSAKAWRAAFCFATPMTERSMLSSIAGTTKTSSGAKQNKCSRGGHAADKEADQGIGDETGNSQQKRRAPSFPKAPFIFDGGKPNSVDVIAHADDHLSHPAFAGRPTRLRAS